MRLTFCCASLVKSLSVAASRRNNRKAVELLDENDDDDDRDDEDDEVDEEDEFEDEGDVTEAVAAEPVGNR
jgi:phosphopantothenoylcysteine synthetase/decarboxylase